MATESILVEFEDAYHEGSFSTVIQFLKRGLLPGIYAGAPREEIFFWESFVVSRLSRADWSLRRKDAETQSKTQYYFMNRMGLSLLIVKENKKTNQIIFVQTLKKMGWKIDQFKTGSKPGYFQGV